MQNKWARRIMLLAAIYNLIWGGVISLSPHLMLFGNDGTVYLLLLIRCIGMLVGTYGIAYYFASKDPARYWPLILVGFIGKLLGPIGAAYYVLTGQLNPKFLWVNVGNDLIWLVPFGWVLWLVWQIKQPQLPQTLSVSASLYQQILGDKFSHLAPHLQNFHAARQPVKATGKFNVVYGEHPFCRLLAKLADLPAETVDGEAELIVYPTTTAETWSRRIDNKMVISKQWLKNGFLVERFRIIDIYLTADVIARTLVIKDAFVNLLGVPLPKFFRPKVLATGADTAEGVDVNVDISFSPFGRIINYKGTVKIETIP